MIQTFRTMMQTIKEERAQVLGWLERDAQCPLYSPEIREKLGKTAAGLKAGTISWRAADGACMLARDSLDKAFETGEAFAASLPAETRAAREQYLQASVLFLTPQLRADGLDAALAALEGAQATGDLNALGKACRVATQATSKAAVERYAAEHPPEPKPGLWERICAGLGVPVAH